MTFTLSRGFLSTWDTLRIVGYVAHRRERMYSWASSGSLAEPGTVRVAFVGLGYISIYQIRF